MGLILAPRPDMSAVYVETAFLVVDVVWGTTVTGGASKMLGYARAGIKLYLRVDVQLQNIDVYRLDGETYGEPEVLSSHAVWQPAALDGLQLDLSKLWM